MVSFPSLFSSVLFATSAVAASSVSSAAVAPPSAPSTYTWPNYFLDELEHLWVDSAGYNEGIITRGVTPCSIYIQGPQTLGRQTSAQWMRVAFHDFATAIVANGTGGIDASIGWETNRPEDTGAAMNDSLGYWAAFVNKQVSMADMVALGTVLATASCQGPIMPYYVGRVDATEAGPFGVPQPQQSVETMVARIEQAGMNQTEFIQLTACGHTIGATHHAGFPDIVNASAVTPNNTGGGIPFDNTKDVFDNGIVTMYLDGDAPDAMVTSFNETVRSDLRLFASDGNVTMEGLRDEQVFESVCNNLLTRMLNTVPAGVQLQQLQPLVLKPVNVQLSITPEGELQLTGAIRLLSTSFVQGSSVQLSLTDGSSKPAGTAPTTFSSATTGSSITIPASTYYHLFNTTIPASTGISGFTVSVQQNAKSAPTTYTNGRPGALFEVQDSVMWVPQLSSFALAENNQSAEVILVAAVKTGVSDPTVVFSVPTPQIGTQTPLIVEKNASLAPIPASSSSSALKALQQRVAAWKVPAGYELLYTAQLMPNVNGTASRTTFDVVGTLDGQQYVDEFRKMSVLANATDTLGTN